MRAGSQSARGKKRRADWSLPRKSNAAGWRCRSSRDERDTSIELRCHNWKRNKGAGKGEKELSVKKEIDPASFSKNPGETHGTFPSLERKPRHAHHREGEDD